MLGIGRTTLHQIRSKDLTFPKQIKEEGHRQAHIYFVKAEVVAWIKAKADNRPPLQSASAPSVPPFESLRSATELRSIPTEQHRTALVGNTEVIKMLGMQSVSGLNKLRVRDKTFPMPIKTSDARGARAHLDPVEVEQWIADKKAARHRVCCAEQ